MPDKINQRFHRLVSVLIGSSVYALFKLIKMFLFDKNIAFKNSLINIINYLFFLP
ncbi:hypothetical protein BH23BAC1_BH23BAC1_11230 [soil metagenome]